MGCTVGAMGSALAWVDPSPISFDLAGTPGSPTPEVAGPAGGFGGRGLGGWGLGKRFWRRRLNGLSGFGLSFGFALEGRGGRGDG